MKVFETAMAFSYNWELPKKTVSGVAFWKFYSLNLAFLGHVLWFLLLGLVNQNRGYCENLQTWGPAACLCSSFSHFQLVYTFFFPFWSSCWFLKSFFQHRSSALFYPVGWFPAQRVWTGMGLCRDRCRKRRLWPRNCEITSLNNQAVSQWWLQ